MTTDYWVGEQQGGWITGLFNKVLVLVIPDFQIFNITDSISAGQTVPLSLIAQMSALSLMYVVIFTIVSLFLFSDKEF